MAWRPLVASLALPPPLSAPSIQQLKDILRALENADTDRDGLVSLEEFVQVPLWFEPQVLDTAVNAIRSGPPQAAPPPHSLRGLPQPDLNAPLLEAARKLKVVLFHLVSNDVVDNFSGLSEFALHGHQMAHSPSHSQLQTATPTAAPSEQATTPAPSTTNQAGGALSGQVSDRPESATHSIQAEETEHPLEPAVVPFLRPIQFVMLFCYDDDHSSAMDKMQILASSSMDAGDVGNQVLTRNLDLIEQGYLVPERQDPSLLVAPVEE
jgi:hypothetical protein